MFGEDLRCELAIHVEPVKPEGFIKVSVMLGGALMAQKTLNSQSMKGLSFTTLLTSALEQLFREKKSNG